MAIDPSTIAAAVKAALETQGVHVVSGDDLVPVGVSNRHIHLTAADVEVLFGKGYELSPMKELSQPGQYACKEQLTLIGPSMRAIEKVRVLGPLRKATQVEISRTDSYTLKIKAPVRESGKLDHDRGAEGRAEHPRGLHHRQPPHPYEPRRRGALRREGRRLRQRRGRRRRAPHEMV